MSLAINYPDYFPCPTWQYAHQLHAYQERVEFSSGWTRQRRQWPEAGITFQLSFNCNAKSFFAWSAWMWANGHDWFLIRLDDYDYDGEGDAHEVRLISDASYSYNTWDDISVSVVAEVKPEPSAATTPPIPAPGHPGFGPIPPTEIYCLEYECDAYSVWAGSGDGTYYFPCQNPVTDGYLEGTVNVPITGPYQNINSPVYPGACANWESWKANDGAGMIFYPTLEVSHTATAVYLYGGGSSDITIFSTRVFWTNPSYPNESINCHIFLQVDPFDVDIRQVIAYANMASQGGNFATGTIDQNEPTAIGYTFEMPETVTNGQAFAGSITCLINGEAVSVIPVTGTISNNSPAGTVFTYEPNSGNPTDEFNMMGTSADCYFSDIAIMGSSHFDLAAWKQAWDQNQTDYNDPDPDCTPRPAVTYEIPE